MEENSCPEGGSRLETVIIFTARMEELAAFYQGALGIGPFERSPRHMGCRLGHVYFGFDQVDEAQPSADSGGVTLWFTVADLRTTFDRLVAMGAKVRSRPAQKAWGAFLASVYDLDGNLLGLAQRQDQSA